MVSGWGQGTPSSGGYAVVPCLRCPGSSDGNGGTGKEGSRVESLSEEEHDGSVTDSWGHGGRRQSQSQIFLFHANEAQSVEWRIVVT